MSICFWRSGGSTPLEFFSVAPNDARLLVSDYAGIDVRDATRLKFIRPIVEGNNYRHASPGARVSFVTDALYFRPRVYWNALVTRLDTFNAVVSVLVDNVELTSFGANVAANQTGTMSPVVNLPAGSKTVTLVWPYGAGMELQGIDIAAGASLSISTRPSAKMVNAGDSMTQGYTTSRSTQTYAYRLAALQNRQLINIANGSEGAAGANGAALTGLGADKVTYLIGFNNFAGQTPLATFQASVQAWIAAARTALPSAAIRVISPIYSGVPNNNYGPLLLSQYRASVQAAVTAAADVNCTFINGLTLMTNSNDRLADNVHPNDIGAAEIATALNALI